MSIGSIETAKIQKERRRVGEEQRQITYNGRGNYFGGRFVMMRSMKVDLMGRAHCHLFDSGSRLCICILFLSSSSSISSELFYLLLLYLILNLIHWTGVGEAFAWPSNPVPQVHLFPSTFEFL